MSGFSKINYKGKEIIYLDYRGASEEQMIEYLCAAEETILEEQKPFMTLTNIYDAYATKGYLSRAQELGRKTQHLSIAGAIVGVTGGKLVLLKVFNRMFAKGEGLKPFDTEEEALDYLVSQCS
ncbi:hypothetical protein [Reichenbachiella ulvae]|uniref:SpoIIAA-like n=1 Tax=Reichenbachiella ulvae TaxID=2980104 RepID=A0ABT3CPD4_9BACT|nr:hypothetical protein [Reichenbachiella ulvae]MCV9385403.1 hypothetical protein [Reichenbachiella ulvae]